MWIRLAVVFVVIVSVLSIVQSAERSSRFTLYDESYEPKYWKLIPRTRVVPASELKAPFDVVPDDFFKFIPTYVGSVIPGQTLSWTSSCFTQNTAQLKVEGNSRAWLTIDVANKTSFLCDDGYLMAYVGSFDINYYEIPGEKLIYWEGDWSEDTLYDINTLGIRIFRFPDGLTMTTEQIYETIMLFFGGLIGVHVPEWTAEQNLQFLQDHMNVTMPQRSITRVNISTDQVQSGDFLGVLRLDGLDPMLAWAMGSHTGHTCITIWIDGKLYVAESTVKSQYWPTDGIQITPWETWLDQAEKANYNVVHLPLDPKIAAKFNVNNAIAFFKSVEGLPYGFHNLFTGWIDTPEDNYPAPLSSQLVQLLAPFAEWLLQEEIGLGQTFDFLTQGLNWRLNTNGLSITQAYMVSKQKGISFTDLITMPEQDSWTFVNSDGRKGPSMVCDVFVMEMWKAGGIFGDLTSSIEATEFTNWDAYSLNIFNANYVRPQQCVEADPDSQFCQLLGNYRMALPDYNSVHPFSHMREKCPSEPPHYIKPANC